MDVVARASRRLFPWALLLFLAVGARAEMVFKPLLGVSALSGHTTYDISFAGYDLLLDPTGGTIWGASKLEFDLKALLMGVGLEASTPHGGFFVRARYDFSVQEGKGIFRDRDWYYNDYAQQVLHYDPLVGDTFSPTSSPVRQLDLGVGFGLLRRKGFRLSASLDYLSQKFGRFDVYKAKGVYDGWMSPTGDPYLVVISETKPILTYEVTYRHYLAGLAAETDLGKGFAWEGFARAGVLSYRDFDDHILRSRTAEAKGYGGSANLGCALRWVEKGGFGVEATVDYKTLSAEGDQEQHYYGGGYAGYSDWVGEEVSSSQWALGLNVNYRFGPRDSSPRP
jgi:hypothetical protein